VNVKLPRKLPPRCKHGLRICEKCIIVDDAAHRMSDIINSLMTFNQPWAIRNCWIAVRLADGGFDNNIYATREEAINHQADERFCAYAYLGTFVGSAAKPLDCAIFLKYHRDAYDAGMRLHEPDAPQLILPTSTYDRVTGRSRFRAN
jgi:hypothetical protein